MLLLIQFSQQQQQQQQQPANRRTTLREESTGSPSKRSVVWDPLWSVDYTYESSPNKK